MPADIEVRGVQLPGREGRHGEPPFRRLANAVDAVGAAIRPYLDRPFALFGHSMGASLAYEVARWLLAETGSEPVHLFVSARRAPHLPPRRRELHLLSDDAFIEGIRALNGTSAEIFEHPELIRLLLPTLRADFEMAETYKESDRPRLSCPITAIGGDIDQDVPAEDLSAWRIATSGRFQMRLFAGGHFYVNTARDELFRFLSVELAAFGEA